MKSLKDIPPDAPGIPYREWQLKHGTQPLTDADARAWIEKTNREEGEAAQKYKRKRNFEQAIEKDDKGREVLHQQWK